ncbi:MAG: hypothetical protein ACYTF1_27460, partial [Planctomycetota bacterium]|jgi:hypothetical protein
MPALGRTRKQAQAVVDLQQLHSWGVAFQMFADDHEGYFPASIGTSEDYWIVAMLPYIGARAGESSEIRGVFLCPSAPRSKNLETGSSPDVGIIPKGTTTSAWGPFGPAGSWWDTGAMGSYGFNDWCANPPLGEDTYWLRMFQVGITYQFSWMLCFLTAFQ